MMEADQQLVTSKLTMTYSEALTILQEVSKRPLLYPIYLRLERMNLLFKKLSLDPTSPSVHIAGTSGKGSTSSLCAAVLKEAGYTVGLHTTPHLQTPRERMQVNGVMPSEAEFATLVEAVWLAAQAVEHEHSYGAYNSQELTFTIAALYFAHMHVDIAVVETFMGGQYDPTNVIQPLLSVITNVDLDHTKLLGKTVESIAMVKAGVIKPNTPFITGATQASVLSIFRQRCRDLQTNCIVIGEHDQHQARLLGQKGSMLSAQVLDNLFANLHIRLLGRHQINNALVVLYIVQVLRSRGWLVADTAIRQAFSQAFIPGRLEIVQQQPLTVLDGAHNPAKARALATSLRRIFRGKKVIFIFAMKKGKNLEESLRPLLPLAKKFIITRFSEKRSRSTAYISSYLRTKGIPVTTRLDPVAALTLAQSQAQTNDLICITGSLYLVGQLRNYWYPTESKSDTVLFDDTAWPSIVGEPIRQTEIGHPERA